MHPIQERLLSLSKRDNLAKLTLREMAARIGLPDEAPQKIKHHLQQLERRGLLLIDRSRGTMERASARPTWSSGVGVNGSDLFSIPILGTANCGPAMLEAEENLQGFLRVSARLAGRSRPAGLYAIKAEGSSMNRADIGGRRIEDGDYLIIDGKAAVPRDGDVVVAIVDNRATVKEFIDDRDNGQIVLRARSSLDYEPIHIHPEDDFSISGKVIAVVKNPRST
jgi:repressor LexA